MADAVTERDLPLDGFAVRLREAGAGNGPPVLCVHGGPGMDARTFFPDPGTFGPGLRALAGRRHVIAYDQRGCGGSGVPDEEQPLALSRHVDDIDRVRAALGIERADLFAHSFGTVLAILFAVRHPERLARLVLSGCAPTMAFQDGYRRAVRDELPEADRARLAELQRGPLDDAALLERFRLALPLYFHRHLSDAELDAFVAPLGFSARVNRALAAALEEYDLTPALPHVRAPTLVVYGERDRAVQPRYQREIEGKLLTARFVAFQDSGHFPFIEEPEPFARVVDYFLSRPEAPAEMEVS